ncbi:DUF3846 domain-containing protein [Prescottella subtropica]|uniref:DUF3846 domain-containing protein n=1 Tax=Prescottella subtropica TaxID=2545757 RepID=UPI001386C638|nr:DUF3846 domain-containing protein [Prescottella subtropica]
MQALRISTDSNITRVDLTVGGRDTLDGLTTEIGCRHVDVVALPDGNGGTIDMWVDDEGMYGGEVNPAASAVALLLEPRIVQSFFGNAVFAAHNGDGDTVALSDRQIGVILDKLADATRVPADQRDEWVFLAARALGVTLPARV